ncbi:MAG TPA: transporter, partial [Burkholderiaceae bacterium]|nr:transporter [Burkholderiaceae bacterium]
MLLSACVLFGCAHQVDLQQSAATVDIPSDWSLTASGDAQIWPQSDWWNQLGSDELIELVNQGRANNLEIAAAIARVQQAESIARIAGAPLLPNMDFVVDGNRTLPAASSDGVPNTSGLLEVGYEVDFWG